MKTKLIVSFSLLSLILCAQSYKSYFGKEYNKWYVLYDGILCPNTFNYLTCVNRETMINGKTYQLLFKIQELSDDTINSVPVSTVSNQYLREDSVTGKLYYLFEKYSDAGTFISYSPEILVSDMSLHVGDSIALNVTGSNLLFWDNLRLSTYDNKYYAMADSVYFKDGLKHVRTTALFNSPGAIFEKQKTALTFIEGIGSNLTPILDYGSFAYMSDVWKLMCNVKDDNSTYFNTSGLCRLYLYCDGVGVRETKDNHQFILMLPDGNIKIEFTSSFYGSVKLIQSTGMVIYETPVVNAIEQIINTQNLQGGVYILQIINSNGMITARKLIL